MHQERLGYKCLTAERNFPQASSSDETQRDEDRIKYGSCPLKTVAELLNSVGQNKEPELLRTELSLPQAFRVEKTEVHQTVSQKLKWAPSKEQDDPELYWDYYNSNAAPAQLNP